MEETATAPRPSSPPEGYLSLKQAAAVGTLKEWQLRHYIARGFLPVVTIEPVPGPQWRPGRKPKKWISPDALAELERKTRKPIEPSVAPRMKKARSAAAQKVKGGDVSRG